MSNYSYYGCDISISYTMAYHNELGKKGEQLAVDYLINKGYTILDRNYFFKKAEIDIIALKGELLVVVEVKTRNSDFFGDPHDFISRSQIKRLVAATDNYIETNDLDLEVRFDIISILKNENFEKLVHFENAFYHF